MISNICWEQTYPPLDFEPPHKERLTKRRLKDIGNGRECITQGNFNNQVWYYIEIVERSVRNSREGMKKGRMKNDECRGASFVGRRIIVD